MHRGSIEEFLVAREDVARQLQALHQLQEQINTINAHGVPQHFIDPITEAIMRDPVTAEDGHNYERRHIQRVIKECKDQGKPLASLASKQREPMGDQLVPNTELKQEIDEVCITLSIARVSAPAVDIGSTVVLTCFIVVNC